MDNLDAYYLAEGLKDVTSWKDFYNKILDYEDISEDVFKSLPSPVIQKKKSDTSGYNLKKGMKAVSGKTRAAQLKEIMKDTKAEGGLLKGYAEGGLTYDKFKEGVIRNPDKSEDFWRGVKELIPFANYQEKKLNDPHALMNQSAMLADIALPTPGKLGIGKKIYESLQKYSSKLLPNIFKKKQLLKSPEEIVNYFKEGVIKGDKDLTTLGFDLGESMRGKGGVPVRAAVLKRARELLFEESESFKNVDINKYGYLAQLAQGPREAMEALVGRRSTHGNINTAAKEWVTKYLETGDVGEIPIYAKGGGTDSVIAALSPGEFVLNEDATDKIVGKYGLNALEFMNKRGELPKFALGGVVDNHRYADGGPVYDSKAITSTTIDTIDTQRLGEEIGDSIARKLESITFRPVELADDYIEISQDSIKGISDAIENVNRGVTAVGAEESTTKIDEFIDAATSRLETFAVKIDEQSESIEVLHTNIEEATNRIDNIDTISINDKLGELELTISELVNKDELNIIAKDGDSTIDYKIHEAINFIEERYIAGVKTDINIINGKISDLQYDLDDTKDNINGHVSRLGFGS
jgi:hypothetical protein